MNRTERVIEAANKSNLKDIDFAKRIGASKQQFANWKSGAQGVPEKYLIKIVEEFPTVNARWLITGEGSLNGVNHSEQDDSHLHELLLMKDQIIQAKDEIISLLKK